MWLILLMLAIFISVWTLPILDLCQRTYRSGWTQENLICIIPSPEIRKLVVHDEFWQGITGAAPTKSLCFIFTIPVHFIHSTIKVSQHYFVFTSLIFIFHIILQSFKETPPSQLLSGAIPWRVINAKRDQPAQKHWNMYPKDVMLKAGHCPFQILWTNFSIFMHT